MHILTACHHNLGGDMPAIAKHLPATHPFDCTTENGTEHEGKAGD